ncbi:hypothetical protein OH492_11520 [Vibrio chagasii]|nr:hypothetical protein [Vibrio chagasii]
MPAFDIATVDEDEASRVDITDTVGKLCDVKPAAAHSGNEMKKQVSKNPASTDAKRPFNGRCTSINERLTHARQRFNWGYDPFHCTVPEGSCAADPNGSKRIPPDSVKWLRPRATWNSS